MDHAFEEALSLASGETSETRVTKHVSHSAVSVATTWSQLLYSVWGERNFSVVVLEFVCVDIDLLSSERSDLVQIRAASDCMFFAAMLLCRPQLS